MENKTICTKAIKKIIFCSVWLKSDTSNNHPFLTKLSAPCKKFTRVTPQTQWQIHSGDASSEHVKQAGQRQKAVSFLSSKITLLEHAEEITVESRSLLSKAGRELNICF